MGLLFFVFGFFGIVFGVFGLCLLIFWDLIF